MGKNSQRPHGATNGQLIVKEEYLSGEENVRWQPAKTLTVMYDMGEMNQTLVFQYLAPDQVHPAADESFASCKLQTCSTALVLPEVRAHSLAQ